MYYRCRGYTGNMQSCITDVVGNVQSCITDVVGNVQSCITDVVGLQVQVYSVLASAQSDWSVAIHTVQLASYRN